MKETERRRVEFRTQEEAEFAATMLRSTECFVDRVMATGEHTVEYVAGFAAGARITAALFIEASLEAYHLQNGHANVPIDKNVH